LGGNGEKKPMKPINGNIDRMPINDAVLSISVT
jgi:hypothetical protein